MERLWNSNFVKAMLGNFLLFFAFYLTMPLLPLYLKDAFDANKDTIGVVLSGFVVAALLVRPFSGFIVDNFPRKKVLMLCYFMFVIFFFSFFLFCFCVFIFFFCIFFIFVFFLFMFVIF